MGRKDEGESEMYRIWKQRIAKVWDAEAGMSVTELLISLVLMIVLLTASLAALEVMFRQQPRLTNRADRIQAARAALERMTRDLRQTVAVNGNSSASIDVLTYVRTDPGQPAVQRRVVYTCTSGDCARQDGPVYGELGSPVTVFDGASNADIFSYLPSEVNPTFVRIKFRFDIKGDAQDPGEPYTLSDGVQFRNTVVPS